MKKLELVTRVSLIITFILSVVSLIGDLLFHYCPVFSFPPSLEEGRSFSYILKKEVPLLPKALGELAILLLLVIFLVNTVSIFLELIKGGAVRRLIFYEFVTILLFLIIFFVEQIFLACFSM